MKRTFLLTATLLLLVCPGCTEEAVEYTYTETYVRLEELYGTDWFYNGTLMVTETDGHVYRFDNGISEEDRASCIAVQEKICTYLGKNGISTDGLVFTVLEDCTNRAASAEKTAYICADTAGTWEQILTTLQTALGEYTNYGYLYALSNHTAESLGLAQDDTESAGNAVFAENPVLLNLVWPCFTEPYASPDEIAACKALSAEILSQMKNPYAGEDIFLDCLGTYAVSVGTSFTPTTLAFAYNAPSCPMKIRTRYLEIFRDSTYDAAEDPDSGITDDLDGLITYLETLDSCFDDMHEIFGVGKTEYVPVHLCSYVPNRTGYAGELAGMFWTGNGYPEIIAKALAVLQHEYAHYLFRRYTDASSSDSYESWQNEVIANYFAKEQSFNDRLALIEKNNNAELFQTLLGKPYDTVDDEIAFMHIAVGTMTDNPLYELKTVYRASLSFGAYFADLYGEKNLIECMADANRTPELTGYTLDEIVEQWCAWLPKNESE